MIYLYVKTHKVTGLKYFGKTVKDPTKYRGSGLLWKRHIAKHGNLVDTVVVGQYEDQAEATRVAIQFSIDNDIVASDGWANLQVENGLDGAPIGHKGHEFTAEDRAKLSAASLSNWDREGRRDMQSAVIAASWTDDRKAQHSALVSEMWDEAAREVHAERLRYLHESEPERFAGFVEYAKAPKNEDHKANISKALKGRPKSEAHRESLRQAALRRYSKKPPQEENNV